MLNSNDSMIETDNGKCDLFTVKAHRGSVYILYSDFFQETIQDSILSETQNHSDIVEHLSHHSWQVEVQKLGDLHASQFGKRHDKPAYKSTQIDQVLPNLDCDYFILIPSGHLPAPDWFGKAMDMLAGDQADLVICDQRNATFVNRLGLLALERLTGCQSASAQVLVARRSSMPRRLQTLRPAGRWVSLELQLRLPKTRVVVEPSEARPPVGDNLSCTRIGHTELSFIKSYIDHRFGNVSRLIQFCAVGFSGMFVDLSLYAFFQSVLRDSQLSAMNTPIIGGSADLAIAGFLAVWLAMTWNFLLNRRLTFNDARRNASILRQYMTYVMGNALAIAVSLVIRLWLPTQVAFFNSHKLVAALVGIVLATGISFSMARYFVFKSPSISESGTD